MKNEEEIKTINVEQVIHDKNPKLAKMLPGFVLNYIKRIIHEKEVNDFIHKHGHKHDLEFVNAIISEFRLNIHTAGEENIPAQGGCIIASNHPLGGLDAMALFKVVSGRRTDMKFIVNDILLRLKNLRELFIGVNKHGKTSSQMLEEIDNLYASEKAVLIFPAGLVSRKQGEKIKDLEWKKSFISKAKKHHRNIIPAFIDARNSDWFYNLSLWRKRMGIGANIEMFYLVDEMYRQQNKTITITFGQPLSWQIFDKRHNDQEWAQKVKEQVYAIGSGNEQKMIK